MKLYYKPFFKVPTVFQIKDSGFSSELEIHSCKNPANNHLQDIKDEYASKRPCI